MVIYDGFKWVLILDVSSYDERCDGRFLRMWCTEEMGFCQLQFQCHHVLKGAGEDLVWIDLDFISRDFNVTTAAPC